MNTYNPSNIQNNIENLEMANMVDRLVSLRANKANIDKQVKALETTFKAMMVEQEVDRACFESYEHVVTVTKVASMKTAWKALCENVGYSEFLFKKHTKPSLVNRLTVSAKSKK